MRSKFGYAPSLNNLWPWSWNDVSMPPLIQKVMRKRGYKGRVQGMSNLVDALDFLKSYRELDSEKVVSLPTKSKKYNGVQRQFKNIRPLGRQNTNLKIRSGPSKPWNPTKFLFGQAPRGPFLGQGGSNGQGPSRLGFNNQRLNIGARPMNKMPPRKNLRG